jgi:arsenate reductase
MAEGWARALRGDKVEAYSAGIEKHGMNPHAVKVMAEAGVDISRHYSKTPAAIGPVEFDYVVTVCGHADEEIRLDPKKGYVAAMMDWKDPLYQKIVEHLPAGSGPEDYITSLEVTAGKPACQCCCG